MAWSNICTIRLKHLVIWCSIKVNSTITNIWIYLDQYECLPYELEVRPRTLHLSHTLLLHIGATHFTRYLSEIYYNLSGWKWGGEPCKQNSCKNEALEWSKQVCSEDDTVFTKQLWFSLNSLELKQHQWGWSRIGACYCKPDRDRIVVSSLVIGCAATNIVTALK